MLEPSSAGCSSRRHGGGTGPIPGREAETNPTILTSRLVRLAAVDLALES